MTFYRTFSHSYKLPFPGFSGKGILKKVKYEIQKKIVSGKDLIDSINIPIKMSFCFSNFSSTLINSVKNSFCTSTLGQTLQFNDR